jgi:hypothetical protein
MTGDSLAPNRKQLLLGRSALCRLQLRRQSQQLRHAMQWQRVAASVVRAPAARRIALGLLLSWIGAGRATRFMMIAGRVIVFARLANSAIAYLRTNASSPSAGITGPRNT